MKKNWYLVRADRGDLETKLIPGTTKNGAINEAKIYYSYLTKHERECLESFYVAYMEMDMDISEPENGYKSIFPNLETAKRTYFNKGIYDR